MYHCIFFLYSPLDIRLLCFALLCFAWLLFPLIWLVLVFATWIPIGSVRLTQLVVIETGRKASATSRCNGPISQLKTVEMIRGPLSTSLPPDGVCPSLPSLPPFPSPLPHTHTSSAWPTPINHQLSAIISIIRALFVSTWPTSTLRGYSDWLCPVNDAITGRLEKTSVPNPASFNANWISWNVSYV